MKILYLVPFLLFTTIANSQSLVVSPGTDITILSGTAFKTDSLTLTPSANFTFSDNTITKTTTVIHTTKNPYILRVYQFANNTNPFTGSIQLDYTDGAELNGIPEAALTLNVHDGTSWTGYPIATRDGTNNFVLTNGLAGVTINEMTLANLLTPLPLVWSSFTVTRQDNNALLQWTTEQEENTRNFVVQHSSNGNSWANIGTLPAAGNSNYAIDYSYVHASPATGLNYYRILQTDIDNRGSYSEIKVLRFTDDDEPVVIMGNPVTNVLALQVNTASFLSLYSSDGKLLWQEQVNTGTKYIDVSRYAKGTYLLKTNTTVQKVVIQ
jgi:hypothetical protein